MVSPADIDYEESMCTLRYAARVKCIKNYAKINVEEKGLIEGFELEIAELQQKLLELSIIEQKKEQVIFNFLISYLIDFLFNNKLFLLLQIL